jgi:hypothetical protein
MVLDLAKWPKKHVSVQILRVFSTCVAREICKAQDR